MKSMGWPFCGVCVSVCTFVGVCVFAYMYITYDVCGNFLVWELTECYSGSTQVYMRVGRYLHVTVFMCVSV